MTATRDRGELYADVHYGLKDAAHGAWTARLALRALLDEGEPVQGAYDRAVRQSDLADRALEQEPARARPESS